MAWDFVSLGRSWLKLHNNCLSEILLTEPNVRGYLIPLRHYNTFVEQRLGNQALAVSLARVFGSVFLNPCLIFIVLFTTRNLVLHDLGLDDLRGLFQPIIL